jgi:hypothetical protein
MIISVLVHDANHNELDVFYVFSYDFIYEYSWLPLPIRTAGCTRYLPTRPRRESVCGFAVSCCNSLITVLMFTWNNSTGEP